MTQVFFMKCAIDSVFRIKTQIHNIRKHAQYGFLAVVLKPVETPRNLFSGTETVLLVEDEPAARKLTVRALNNGAHPLQHLVKLGLALWGVKVKSL